MVTRLFKEGEIIFRVGEESEEAYRVITGSVEVVIPTIGGAAKVSHIRSGEIFGEMGMVDEQPRSAEAIAKSEVLVEVIAMDSFIEYLSSDAERLSSYLATVFERLRTSDLALQMALKHQPQIDYIGRDDDSLDEMLGDSGKMDPAADGDSGIQVHLSVPATSESNEEKPIEMEIDKFPFRIGRMDDLGATSPFSNNELSLPDQAPFQVSRNHCAIEIHGSQCVIHDRGSTLGTIVNGTHLGKHHDSLATPLKEGANEVILGGVDSPHQLTIVVS